MLAIPAGKPSLGQALWRITDVSISGIALERIIAEKESRIELKDGPEYRVGDLVMLRNHSRTSKLSRVYRGPFKVCEEKDPNYVIDIDGSTKMIHADQLKLFLRSGEDSRLELCTKDSGSEWSDLNESSDETMSVEVSDSSSEEETGSDVGDANVEANQNVIRTSSGREVKMPARYT